MGQIWKISSYSFLVIFAFSVNWPNIKLFALVFYLILSFVSFFCKCPGKTQYVIYFISWFSCQVILFFYVFLSMCGNSYDIMLKRMHRESFSAHSHPHTIGYALSPGMDFI
jgi:hypothetical protein